MSYNVECQYVVEYLVQGRTELFISPGINQVRVVAVSLPQLTQALFLQKNQTLQNRFLISVTLRWHRVSVACKNQSF